jgi:hypothetical protein
MAGRDPRVDDGAGEAGLPVPGDAGDRDGEGLGDGDVTDGDVTDGGGDGGRRVLVPGTGVAGCLLAGTLREGAGPVGRAVGCGAALVADSGRTSR